MYSVESIMSKFASFLRKNPNSNLGKLMTVFAEQLQDLHENNNKIKEWRSIDHAEGKGLDMIGDIVRQPRGSATDEIYRVLLRSKNAQSYSDGSVNNVIKVISIALDIEPSEFKVAPMWNDPNAPKSAAVKILEVPLQRLNQVGLSPSQFGQLVKKTLSAGVHLENIEFGGTFAFGGIPIELDPNAGFADIEGTTGGTLGAVFVSSQDPELPI